jgi:hypothetical protein
MWSTGTYQNSCSMLTLPFFRVCAAEVKVICIKPVTSFGIKRRPQQPRPLRKIFTSYLNAYPNDELFDVYSTNNPAAASRSCVIIFTSLLLVRFLRTQRVSPKKAIIEASVSLYDLSPMSVTSERNFHGITTAA